MAGCRQIAFGDWLRRLCWGLLMAVVYLTAGTVVYAKLEGWDALTTLYFTSVTCTTTGFGDVHPKSPMGQWFTILYALWGIALMYGSMKQILMFLIIGQESLVKNGIKRLKAKLHKSATETSVKEHFEKANVIVSSSSSAPPQTCKSFAVHHH